jgi:hypothetical protein
MMGKKLRNLALLGGLGAAAYMMGSKKGDSKKDVDTTVDTTADASAGRARDRLGGAGYDRGGKDTTADMSAGQAKDSLENLKKSDAPKKNRIVTKEELKKSGFTNLRDFLNDERKLKRRDGKPAERVEAKDKNKAPTREEGRRPRDVSTAGAIQAANQGIPPTPAGSTNIPTTRSPTSPAGASGRDPSRYGKPVRLDELKKGGMVKSSASKRGDGIAMKGKTRGRMV